MFSSKWHYVRVEPYSSKYGKLTLTFVHTSIVPLSIGSNFKISVSFSTLPIFQRNKSSPQVEIVACNDTYN